MFMNIIAWLFILALIAIVVYFLHEAKEIPCPKCKQIADIVSKGDEFITEYYCSNCNYKYDLHR